MVSYLLNSRAGKVMVAALAVFALVINPSVIGLADTPTPVLGIDLSWQRNGEVNRNWD
jgi:hypothetical protein